MTFCLEVKANPIKSGSVVKIIEAIDGDSLKTLQDNGEVSLVRLIGVDSKGSDLAFKFLNNEYTGKTAVIMLDPGIVPYANMWNYAFVYANGVCINNTLLEKGYAKPDIAHINANNYYSMAELSSTAKQESIGVWSENLGDSYYKGYLININTARKEILMEYLNGIDEATANNIILYRNMRPFKNKEGLKNIFGITNDIYLKNQFLITTSTNLNNASFEELMSLGRMDSATANEILGYRYKSLFTNPGQLYEKSFISRSEFNLIIDFIRI
ncbi:MAG: helix-hairpin-helix domain-containing protein [Clostridiales bacterium]|jgi:DNA uptake protein ComE-like DNA-binding protein|nr:helix-hairpin-helix domain-containing protein [Clostridiales bacterium]